MSQRQNSIWDPIRACLGMRKQAQNLKLFGRIFALCIPLCMLGKGKPVDQQKGALDVESPWLTGPLIAPSSRVIPAGHINLEPYLYCLASTGKYTNSGRMASSPTFWTNISQELIQIGIFSWMDFQLVPAFAWNYSQGQGSLVIGDLPVKVDFQLYQSSGISLKLALTETVPLGKYRSLNPKKKGTQAGGAGSWCTEIGLVLGGIYHGGSVHFLTWRLNCHYNLSAPVHLKGYTVYGGEKTTNARFFPASSFSADLGLEWTLAQTWALALDILGSWAGTPHCTGFAGLDALGNKLTIGSGGASIQYSLAPALEYNWSPNLGIIGGVWFTIAGRNAQVFKSGVFALNYYH